MAQAVILGHSYISRLHKDVQNGIFPNNFGLREFKVAFVSRPGATVSTLNQILHQVTQLHPRVVVLQIGGNDFSGDRRQDHLDVASGIVRLARRLRAFHSVEAVYVGKLFYRNLHTKYLPTSNHVDRYNSKVDDVNTFLDSVAKTLKSRQISIHNHKGRQQLRHDILQRDGTHLNNLGAKKFYRSIRGALIASKPLLS